MNILHAMKIPCMVKVGSWNIRGLNDPLKQKEVRSVILANMFSLFGVVETKVRGENIQSTMAVCLPHSWKAVHCWKAVHNYTTGPVARIFLGWDSAVFSVSPVFTSDQLIVVEVDLIQDKRNFLLSVVYGHNRIGDRRSLWEDMSC
ncbi:hypothetical protein RHGRI_024293 [Rhododendron griersonianum]|uniref:Endonuclease/exonuclease/phosphatase n=1 Tax=Rhododendron griersonianum TaxID=479676 RepID=A0AAV6J906_9ERIC|nr:hypothetical protein RHGRI_024293 [Rhododendron griersonianum]